MRWPIQVQLLLPMLAVVVVAIVLASSGVAWWRVGQVRTQQEESLRRIAATLADASFPLNERVLRQMSGLSGAEFVLLDSAGNVEHATLDLAADDVSRLLAVPPERELRRFSASPTVRLAGRNYLGSKVPLARRLPSGRTGVLTVLYEEERWSAVAYQAAYYPSLLAGGVMAAAVVLMTAALARRLVRPIRRLGSQTAAIAGGDFTPVAVPSRNDEIRDLAVSINSMTGKLSQYEEQVRRSERMRTLGQLGAGMAHQLRNSATGASMAIELHQRECAAGAESLEVALRQLRLMESYLQRFLTLGRAEPVPHQEVELGALIDDVLELVRPACRHARIDLSVRRPQEPLRVWGDPESLRQLLVNLVINAVEAARLDTGRPEAAAPGRVIVELARAESGRALLCVKDSGPGPAESMKDKLFEPFATEKPDGTGLGLYVARQIAEAHRGSIAWQRCEGITCFTVELPMDL